MIVLGVQLEDLHGIESLVVAVLRQHDFCAAPLAQFSDQMVPTIVHCVCCHLCFAVSFFVALIMIFIYNFTRQIIIPRLCCYLLKINTAKAHELVQSICGVIRCLLEEKKTANTLLKAI